MNTKDFNLIDNIDNNIVFLHDQIKQKTMLDKIKKNNKVISQNKILCAGFKVNNNSLALLTETQIWNKVDELENCLVKTIDRKTITRIIDIDEEIDFKPYISGLELKQAESTPSSVRYNLLQKEINQYMEFQNKRIFCDRSRSVLIFLKTENKHLENKILILEEKINNAMKNYQLAGFEVSRLTNSELETIYFKLSKPGSIKVPISSGVPLINKGEIDE